MRKFEFIKYYLKYTDIQINNFIISQFGSTLIAKEYLIIELSLKNLKDNRKYIIEINWSKRLLKIKKRRLKKICNLEILKKINNLLCFNDKKIINYWSRNYIYFATYECVGIDLIQYRKYWIKSLCFDHEKNKIIISYEKKDLFLLIHLLFAKIEFLQEEGFPFLYIKCKNTLILSNNINTYFNSFKHANTLEIHFSVNSQKLIDRKSVV